MLWSRLPRERSRREPRLPIGFWPVREAGIFFVTLFAWFHTRTLHTRALHS
jgi:hypothetical protein